MKKTPTSEDISVARQRMLDSCEDKLMQQAEDLHLKGGLHPLEIASMLLRAATAVAVTVIGPKAYAQELRENADRFERDIGQDLN